MRFLEYEAPHALVLWTLLADIAVLGALILAARISSISRSRPLSVLSNAALAVCVGLALFQVSHWLGELLYQMLPFWSVVMLKVLLFAALLLSLIRAPGKLRPALRALFLILAPALPLFAVHTFWTYRTVDLRRVGAGHGTAPLLPVASNARRVVWIVFDELDERMLFQARPRRIQAHEFDRLRAESMFADRATPPGPETLWSMPSFLLGRKIYDPKMDTSRLSVQFSSGEAWHNFDAQPNVFRTARAEGFNTGLTGWYLPYCRFIGADLSDCTWAALGPGIVWAQNALEREPFYMGMLHLIRWDIRLTFPSLVSSGLLDVTPDDALSRRYQNINAVKVVTQNADRMLGDPKLNFVLIHVPAPHPPGIWNIGRREFALGESDYLDNYELADAILGRIRRTLEENGNWDRTTLLVTSDHPYRPELWAREHFWNAEMAAITGSRKYPYVPFFLKLPHQRAALHYRREFNNVVSGALLLDILRGTVTTPEQAAAWIDRH